MASLPAIRAERECHYKKEGKMKKLITILSTLLLLHFISYGQFQIDWQQSYGSMETDIAYGIVETDGGYLVTGTAGSGGGQVECFENGVGGGWLLKINESGNLIWQKCYEHAHGVRIVKAIGSSHYYLVGGTISQPYPDAYNLWIAKIDSLGIVIWERSLGNTIGIQSSEPFCQATFNGGIIATVRINSQGGDISNWYGDYDGWVIKLDSIGNTEWDLTLGTPRNEAINGIIQTSDGGYLAGSYGAPSGTGTINCNVQSPYNSEAIVTKIDTNGAIEWNQCYGGSGSDGVITFIELNDGYLIAGWGGSNDGDLEDSGWHGFNDVWLIKTDFTGDIIWQKCYGGSNLDYPMRVFTTSDGGFMVFGNTHSYDGDVVGNPSLGNEPSIWVFKVDSVGNLIRQQCIGGSRTERVYGVVKHSDYKYAVAGEMFYSPSGDVNCSNFVYGSRQNYWVFGISDTTVNIQETPLMGADVMVYPNPAHEYVAFEIPLSAIQNSLHNKGTKCTAHIKIINIFGNLMIEQPIIDEKTVWDTRKVPSGVYFYMLKSDEIQITGKFIIQH